MFDPREAIWWKFNEYEILRTPTGDSIVPTKGARFEKYSLGEDGQIQQPPYVQLFHATSSLTRNHGDTVTAERAILEWCARFGTLGAALDGVLKVVNPPRWMLLNPDDTEARGVTVEHVFTTQGWETRRQDLGISGSAGTAGAVVSRELLPEGWPAGGVVRRGVGNWPDTLPLMAGERSEPFSEKWLKYFPHIRGDVRRHDFPRPHTEEFWRSYAEPVDEFLVAARTLHGAIRKLAKRPEVTPEPKPRFGKYVESGWITEKPSVPFPDPSGPLVLPDTSDLRVGFYMEDGQVHRRWSFPSLFPFMALAAVSDVQLGHVYECPVCKKVFMSDAWQAIYCSPTCKHTAERRRQRAKVAGTETQSAGSGRKATNRNVAAGGVQKQTAQERGRKQAAALAAGPEKNRSGQKVPRPRS